MDNLYTNELIKLGASLTQLAVKGTVTAITTKVKAIKEEQNVENVKAKYDEIINELLSEREEAVRIAQAYKSELEKVVISDEDIEHLHNTVSRILEVIKNLQDDNSEDNNQVNEQIQTYEQIKELISIDTLKTMQLLGFNYKSAIGEPLTLMLRNFILSKIDDNEAIKKVVTPEMVEILKDETAYKNFKQFTGIEQN
jgi:hypothetical protein